MTTEQLLWNSHFEAEVEPTTENENLADELNSLEGMTEAEACKYYNVDSKAEALLYITDYWS